ncbi:hypothetical protein ABG067_000365 [Albugo candida]
MTWYGLFFPRVSGSFEKATMLEDLAKLAPATISVVEPLLHSVTKTIKFWSGSTNMNGSAIKIVFVDSMSTKEPVYTTKITTLSEKVDVAIDEAIKQLEAFREIEKGLAIEQDDSETSSVVEYENEEADILESEELPQEIETLLFEIRGMLCAYVSN